MGMRHRPMWRAYQLAHTQSIGAYLEYRPPSLRDLGDGPTAARGLLRHRTCTGMQQQPKQLLSSWQARHTVDSTDMTRRFSGYRACQLGVVFSDFSRPQFACVHMVCALWALAPRAVSMHHGNGSCDGSVQQHNMTHESSAQLHLQVRAPSCLRDVGANKQASSMCSCVRYHPYESQLNEW